MQGAERARIEGAGVDGAPTPPKAKTAAAASSQTKGGVAPPASGSSPTPTQANGSSDSTKQSPAGQPSTEAGSTPSQSSDETPSTTTESDPSQSDSPEGSASSGKKGPRYELKAFKKWTEENPEQAAELAKAVFQIDVPEGFIKLQNKARKIKGEIRERQTAAETAAQTKLAAAEAARTQAEQVAQQLRPMADMWAAAQRKDERGQPVIDFDTADECFRLNMGGVTIDEYMRQRARRGIAHPELAREKAARLRLEHELAQLKGGQNTSAAQGAQKSNGAAASGSAPEGRRPEANAPQTAAPAAPSVDWGDVVPDDHPLRQLTGWAEDMDREMRRYHDDVLDEYSVNPEEIVEKVFKRRLAALTPLEDDDEPAPRRPPAKRPNTPKRRAAAADGLPDPSELTPRASRQQPPPPNGHRPATADDLDDAGPADITQRERWALQRAQRRLRGEQL